MRSPRPADLAFRFLALFGLVVILSRAAAVMSDGPWFSPELSLLVYSAVLACASLVAVAIVLITSVRASRIAHPIRDSRIRAAFMRMGAAGPAASAPTDPAPERVEAAREATRMIWSLATGPLVLSVLLAAVAAVMLPGVGPFSTRQFELNTTFVLLLSGGWWLVLLWFVVALSAFQGGSELRPVAR